MNERITLVAVFNEVDNDKIYNITNVTDELLCKVPFGKNVTDRITVDTLPYHFTISAWDIENKEFIIEKLDKITFSDFDLDIDTIEIREAKEDSYLLCFNIIVNDELRKLQAMIYNVFPTEKYNPDKFKFHITITVDKDYEKIAGIKKQLDKVFNPFKINVSCIKLFEIYPANLVKEINAVNIKKTCAN